MTTALAEKVAAMAADEAARRREEQEAERERVAVRYGELLALGDEADPREMLEVATAFGRTPEGIGADLDALGRADELVRQHEQITDLAGRRVAARQAWQEIVKRCEAEMEAAERAFRRADGEHSQALRAASELETLRRRSPYLFRITGPGAVPMPVSKGGE
jgi:hypothetical protein